MELSILCQKQIFLVVYDEKTKDMIEFKSCPKFDEHAVDAAKERGVAVHEIFSCDDLDGLKRTNITKYEFPELFTTIDNSAPKRQRKRKRIDISQKIIDSQNKKLKASSTN